MEHARCSCTIDVYLGNRAHFVRLVWYSTKASRRNLTSDAIHAGDLYEIPGPRRPSAREQTLARLDIRRLYNVAQHLRNARKQHRVVSRRVASHRIASHQVLRKPRKDQFKGLAPVPRTCTSRVYYTVGTARFSGHVWARQARLEPTPREPVKSHPALEPKTRSHILANTRTFGTSAGTGVSGSGRHGMQH